MDMDDSRAPTADAQIREEAPPLIFRCSPYELTAAGSLVAPEAAEPLVTSAPVTTSVQAISSMVEVITL